MSVVTVVHLLTIILTGLLAGMELALHHGLRGPMSTLSDEAHLELRKALILRLRILVPSVFVPAALCGLTTTLVSGLGSGMLFRAIGVLEIATWVAGRDVGTVPVGSTLTSRLYWSMVCPTGRASSSGAPLKRRPVRST